MGNFHLRGTHLMEQTMLRPLRYYCIRTLCIRTCANYWLQSRVLGVLLGSEGGFAAYRPLQAMHSLTCGYSNFTGLKDYHSFISDPWHPEAFYLACKKQSSVHHAYLGESAPDGEGSYFLTLFLEPDDRAQSKAQTASISAQHVHYKGDRLCPYYGGQSR